MNEYTILFGTGKVIIDHHGNVLELKNVNVPPAEMPAKFDVMEYYRNVSGTLPANLSCDEIGYTTEAGIPKYPARGAAAAVAAPDLRKSSSRPPVGPVDPVSLPTRLSRDQIVLAAVNQLGFVCDDPATANNMTIWLIVSSIALLDAIPRPAGATSDLGAEEITNVVIEAAEALSDWLDVPASGNVSRSAVLPMNSATVRSLIDRIATHIPG